MSSCISPLLVFSDLDGSLLDHYSYSFQEALPALKVLERHAIPLVLVSSKTRAEILELRSALDNRHPFIVENGAAVFVPQQYFPQQPADTVARDGYWVHEMAASRDHWLRLLSTLEQEFLPEFITFTRAGVAGIMQMTGLPEPQAINANNRGYSEPVKWLGNTVRELQFIQRLQDAGASVAKGGRFLAVSGNCDKGQALRWLRSEYQALTSQVIEDIAIGDSENDLPMLETANTALVIRSPAHDFPTLDHAGSVIHSQQEGPAGWAEGVLQWLSLSGITH